MKNNKIELVLTAIIIVILIVWLVFAIKYFFVANDSKVQSPIADASISNIIR